MATLPHRFDAVIVHLILPLLSKSAALIKHNCIGSVTIHVNYVAIIARSRCKNTRNPLPHVKGFVAICRPTCQTVTRQSISALLQLLLAARDTVTCETLS